MFWAMWDIYRVPGGKFLPFSFTPSSSKNGDTQVLLISMSVTNQSKMLGFEGSNRTTSPTVHKSQGLIY